MSEQVNKDTPMQELIKSLRARGNALKASKDDFMEPLGDHYLGIAEEVESAWQAALAQPREGTVAQEPVALSPEQARHRIAELRANREWCAAYILGDVVKAAEMRDLHRMAFPGPSVPPAQGEVVEVLREATYMLTKCAEHDEAHGLYEAACVERLMVERANAILAKFPPVDERG